MIPGEKMGAWVSSRRGCAWGEHVP